MYSYMNSDQCGPYFRSANDCFIKSQTLGKSSNSGFNILLIISNIIITIIQVELKILDHSLIAVNVCLTNQGLLKNIVNNST